MLNLCLFFLLLLLFFLCLTCKIKVVHSISQTIDHLLLTRISHFKHSVFLKLHMFVLYDEIKKSFLLYDTRKRGKEKQSEKQQWKGEKMRAREKYDLDCIMTISTHIFIKLPTYNRTPIFSWNLTFHNHIHAYFCCALHD